MTPSLQLACVLPAARQLVRLKLSVASGHLAKLESFDALLASSALCAFLRELYLSSTEYSKLGPLCQYASLHQPRPVKAFCNYPWTAPEFSRWSPRGLSCDPVCGFAVEGDLLHVIETQTKLAVELSESQARLSQVAQEFRSIG